ncbi:MAG TPA: metallophosphoesterase, partial [Nitrososphaeraceae archaeon]|nr:metallophosphoesterase [Nitrososphaeraceae archaeon]
DTRSFGKLFKTTKHTKTYYSFDMNNVHIIAIDPYINYGSNSDQYQFIESDLKKVSQNTKIDWIFVLEHIPMYTSPSKHSADLKIRDTYHNLFDKYNVDMVFSGDNHNYQRTFPLEYNKKYSANPIISDTNLNRYRDYDGQIYIITGTAGKSHYYIQQQAHFVAIEEDQKVGFLNVDINSYKTLTATFYANEDSINNDKNNNNVIDRFTILKTT